MKKRKAENESPLQFLMKMYFDLLPVQIEKHCKNRSKNGSQSLETTDTLFRVIFFYHHSFYCILYFTVVSIHSFSFQIYAFYHLIIRHPPET